MSGAKNITPKYIIAFCIKAATHAIGMIEETPAAIIAIRKYRRIAVTALIILRPNVKFSVLKAIYFSSNIQAAKNPIAKPALLANDDIERIGSYKIVPRKCNQQYHTDAYDGQQLLLPMDLSIPNESKAYKHRINILQIHLSPMLSPVRSI